MTETHEPPLTTGTGRTHSSAAQHSILCLPNYSNRAIEEGQGGPSIQTERSWMDGQTDGKLKDLQPEGKVWSKTLMTHGWASRVGRLVRVTDMSLQGCRQTKLVNSRSHPGETPHPAHLARQPLEAFLALADQQGPAKAPGLVIHEANTLVTSLGQRKS